jgi:ribosomal protein S18 acetylase RimI-like enzyme
MDLNFREARGDDLQSLVELLANDVLGNKREDASKPLQHSYIQAFEAIKRDPNNQLLIATSENKLVGMLQLTFIPYLTHKGSWRCLIEGVRVHENFRGQGCGELMFKHAIHVAKQKNCSMVQLTSDKQRPDAIRFYEKLGFTASHEGLKLSIK